MGDPVLSSNWMKPATQEAFALIGGCCPQVVYINKHLWSLLGTSLKELNYSFFSLLISFSFYHIYYLPSATAVAGPTSSSRTGSSCSSLTRADTQARTRTPVSVDRKQVPPLIKVVICVFSNGGHLQLSLTINIVQKTLEIEP